MPLAEARATFPRLPQVNLPNVLNELRLRDHSVEPPIESMAYPVCVQSTDADGNALGGIRHPLLTAPLATHADWSLRATGYGESELFTIQGSMIPFAATEAERQRTGDRVKALAEPAVSRRKKFLRLGPPTLVAEEPREAGRRAQFPRSGLLALRGLGGVSITLLRAPILRTRRRHV